MMKKALLILSVLIGILKVNVLHAQSFHSKEKSGFFNKSGIKKARILNLCGKRNNKVKSTDFQSFFAGSINPKLSIDLLDGSGIYLFTISNIDFIPTIKVGARIKAGIIITI